MTEALSSLDTVLDRYDAILCDVWGVIHNGRRHLSDAARRLHARARGAERSCCSFPTCPNRTALSPANSTASAFRATAWDGIVTSGDAIRAELAKRAPGPMFKIGPPEDKIVVGRLGARVRSARRGALHRHFRAQPRRRNACGLCRPPPSRAGARSGDALRQSRHRRAIGR